MINCNIRSVVTAAVNVNLYLIRYFCPAVTIRSQPAHDAGCQRLAPHRNIAVHAIDNVDAQIVTSARHDHLAKDTGNIVGTVLCVIRPISAGQNIAVVLAGEDICRAAGGRLVKKAHDAADRARTVAIVGIGAKAAEVEGFFNRAAVFQPGGNDAADIVGAAVKHSAKVHTLADDPLVIGRVLLHADHTAHICNFSVASIGRVIVIFAACAGKAAHGSAVDQQLDLAGCLVHADHTADFGFIGRVVTVDKPLTGCRTCDRAVDGVEACHAAQIAAGFSGCSSCAAQTDQQVILGKAGGVDIVVLIRGHRINAFKAIISIAFQGADHVIGVIGAASRKPIVNLLDQSCYFFCTTAAAANTAVVCACHAAHKAVARGDDTAAAFPCGNIAGCNGAVVTARNAAHAAGAFQLFRIGLAVAQARGTHHLQRDSGHTAPIDLTIVQADDAAHGVQHIGCARGDVIVCRSISLAQRALIGTL